MFCQFVEGWQLNPLIQSQSAVDTVLCYTPSRMPFEVQTAEIFTILVDMVFNKQGLQRIGRNWAENIAM